LAKQFINDNIWRERLSGMNRAYEQWEKRFFCDVTEKYYEGEQWKSQFELGSRPYVINKFYENIQIKISEFIPTFPEFLVSAKPASEQFDLESAAKSSNLKQDVLNTLIQDDRANFSQELELAYKDSFFRFGIIECGYSADWIINPRAAKPVLGRDTDKDLRGKYGRKIKFEPPELSTNERIYFKHIGAKRFRVGGLDHKYLDYCSWYGYWEWVRKDDLLAMSGIMNKDKIENAESIEPDPQLETSDRPIDKYKVGAIKMWHIWTRSGQELLILDSPCVTIYQKKFKRRRIFDYRPDTRLITEGFYPIPPSFHWISPQDETNEVREQLRAHRRRFTRKYQVIEGRCDDEEIEKFENGQDGALVKVKVENAISAIQDANLDPATAESIQVSTDDMNHIAGISDAERLVADRMTATQSNQIQGQTTTRQSKDRDRLVKWISGIGREVLMLAHEKFTIGTWVQLTSSEGQIFQDYQANQSAYHWVSTEDLNDGYDFNVIVNVTSISSSAQQEEKASFLEFLATVTQYPQIAFSPILIREAAYRCNYRNEKVIAEMQKQAMVMELGRQQQLMQGQQGGGPIIPAIGPGNNGQQRIAAKTPNTTEKIRNQMANQPQR
jgi:hypothetical protein